MYIYFNAINKYFPIQFLKNKKLFYLYFLYLLLKIEKIKENKKNMKTIQKNIILIIWHQFYSI